MASDSYYINQSVVYRNRIVDALKQLFPDVEKPQFVTSRYGHAHTNMLNWQQLAEWLDANLDSVPVTEIEQIIIKEVEAEPYSFLPIADYEAMPRRQLIQVCVDARLTPVGTGADGYVLHADYVTAIKQAISEVQTDDTAG